MNWISLEERKPEDGQDVIFFRTAGPKWTHIGVGTYPFKYPPDEPYDPYAITHWMPLPDKPSEGDDP